MVSSLCTRGLVGVVICSFKDVGPQGLGLSRWGGGGVVKV